MMEFFYSTIIWINTVWEPGKLKEQGQQTFGKSQCYDKFAYVASWPIRNWHALSPNSVKTQAFVWTVSTLDQGMNWTIASLCKECIAFIVHELQMNKNAIKLRADRNSLGRCSESCDPLNNLSTFMSSVYEIKTGAHITSCKSYSWPQYCCLECVLRDVKLWKCREKTAANRLLSLKD